MNRDKIYNKIERKINLLNKNMIDWDSLDTNIKQEFNSEKEFEIVLKIKEFIENIIDIKKQEINEKNLVYRILVYNLKSFEYLLKEASFLEKEETIETFFDK